MPRFVILEHDHPELHWDFMIEAGEVLQTWRLANAPTPGGVIEAAALSDHRRLYLDYEGAVSGNRGTVRRWDAGLFTEASASTTHHRLFALDGAKLRGSCALQWIEGDSWRFIWKDNR